VENDRPLPDGAGPATAGPGGSGPGALPPIADFVLEGGGVKGAALLGAMTAAVARGVRPNRLAGTSAGAITAAFIAAGLDHDDPAKLGRVLTDLKHLLTTTDFNVFNSDPTPYVRFGGLPGMGISEIADYGLYKGDALEKFIADNLARFGVRTFADLKTSDDPSTPMKDRYRLVVVVSDITPGYERKLFLPWDFPKLGIDPDSQSVAHAVRMSASIPLYFVPPTIDAAGPNGSRVAHTVVDGGLNSNMPVEAFDADPSIPVRWPTLGVRLEGGSQKVEPVNNFADFMKGLIETMWRGNNNALADDPRVRGRTVFVDTSGTSAVDFGITPAELQKLYLAGYSQMSKFLDGFDMSKYTQARTIYDDASALARQQPRTHRPERGGFGLS
jgi:NTE family protein